MALPSQLQAYAAVVDARLAELLPPESESPSELHAAMRYSCLAPGKRLRPALSMECSRAVGGSAANALDGGCAIEMVHCFSLIHDDLPSIDNDDLRRGRPTCHVKFGEAVAILAGDGLFALAYATLGAMKTSPDRIVRCLQSLSKAVGSRGLVGGETLDILSEGKPINEETLLKIHRQKTGALIACACRVGGILGGGSAEEIDALEAYGEEVGMAFQIADDVLNETATPEQLGKSAGSDRERQKATFPALYGLDVSKKLAEEACERALLHLKNISNPGPLPELARFAIERLH